MNLINDLSNLTSIPEKILEKLSDNIMFSILQSLEETLIKKESVCEIDMNIGSLLISLEDDNLKFKFIPSKTLEKEIIKTIEEGKNPMKEISSKKLPSKFDRFIAKEYAVTADWLNVRNGAGVSNKRLVVIPKGTKVMCYGYYDMNGKTKWLYVQFIYKGIKYTGFCSSAYLT